MNDPLSIIILAAGRGKRMCSDLPKVLHQLAGQSLLSHVYQTALSLVKDQSQICIVYGHGGETVPQSSPDCEAVWVYQEQQLGTGHAVAQALPQIVDQHNILILYGDVPLVEHTELSALIEQFKQDSISLLTANLSDPHGYGRIVRDQAGAVTGIVEEVDCQGSQRKITEVNTGIMLVQAERLRKWVGMLKNCNQQKEYYLTDIISLAIDDNCTVQTISVDDQCTVQGVNDLIQLAKVERYYQKRQALSLMRSGVQLLDPARFDLRGSLEIGANSTIDVNVVLEGSVKIGQHVTIGANCWIKDTSIADHVKILPNTIIDGAYIGHGSTIGPFARLRPDTKIAEQVHIGNFVELKKVDIAAFSKASHLSYLGDSQIGKNVNIGAGTITCNYDGQHKHQTIIGDNVFIGSDVQLIAPVVVHDNVVIAAGSTITDDVSKDSLAISRVAQQNRQRRKK